MDSFDRSARRIISKIVRAGMRHLRENRPLVWRVGGDFTHWDEVYLDGEAGNKLAEVMSKARRSAGDRESKHHGHNGYPGLSADALRGVFYLAQKNLGYDVIKDGYESVLYIRALKDHLDRADLIPVPERRRESRTSLASESELVPS